jgi:hypothetical protein
MARRHYRKHRTRRNVFRLIFFLWLIPKKSRARPRIQPRVRNQILGRDHRRCRYCGTKGSRSNPVAAGSCQAIQLGWQDECRKSGDCLPQMQSHEGSDQMASAHPQAVVVALARIVLTVVASCAIISFVNSQQGRFHAHHRHIRGHRGK